MDSVFRSKNDINDTESIDDTAKYDINNIESIDDTVKYDRIINKDIEVIGIDGNIIHENVIDPIEIPDIISYYLSTLDITSINTINRDDIISQLDVPKDCVYNVKDTWIKIELTSLHDFLRYIGSESISKIFVTSDESSEYKYTLDYYILRRLEDYGCDIQEITDIVNQFLYDNNIKITKFSISTINGVGVTFASDMNFLNNIGTILESCIKLINEQREVARQKVTERAIEELPLLLDFLINDDEYKNCTNKVKRKNYKSQEKFLELPQFSNIAEMLYNKPVINTEEYIICRPFYIQYDAVFDMATDIIKNNK